MQNKSVLDQQSTSGKIASFDFVCVEAGLATVCEIQLQLA